MSSSKESLKNIDRDIGNTCLKRIIKQEKNVQTFEKYIYELSDDEKEYKRILYQVSNKIRKGIPLKDVLNGIKEGYINWDNEDFDECKTKLDEQEDFLTNPFQVESGVMNCNKCNSDKVYTYTKQIRRADEGTTVFCVCAKCNAKWKVN